MSEDEAAVLSIPDIERRLNDAVAALPEGYDMERIDLDALDHDIEVYEQIAGLIPDNALYADILSHLKRYRVAVLMLSRMYLETEEAIGEEADD